MIVSRIAILHLEDSDPDAELVRSRLCRAGIDADIHRVYTHADFRAALDHGKFDLVLADYALPDFDGLAALQLTRARWPETPFLFVSGKLGEEVAIDSLQRGATDYVLKQRLDRLGPAVRRALAEAGERARRRQAEEQYVRQLRGLAAIAARLHGALDVGTVLRLLADETRELLGVRWAGAELAARPGGTTVSASSPSEAAAPAGAAALVQRVRELSRPVRLARADLPAAVGSAVNGWLGAALCARHGTPLGVLHVADKETGDFTDHDEALVGQLARLGSVALENARLYQELARNDRRKDEFLAMLAHELRNPLAPIRNAVQLWRLAGPAEGPLGEARDVIDRQVRHMSRLIDDLLDVSRITRGKVQLRTAPVALAEVVERAVETHRPLIEARGHRLEVRGPEDPIVVDGDPTRLAQIIGNLLDNAAKYTPSGGALSLGAGLEQGRAVVRVRDNGEGISAELLPHIFELFMQAERSLDRSQGGLGIGLTLVKSLAELHGGTVEAHSEGPGKGSEFVVRLPVQAPADRAAQVTAELGGPPAPRRVLVVDDNADAADTLALVLRLRGQRVQVAYDGARALEAAQTFRPDIVFVDIGLPGGMDGFELARHLRAACGTTPRLFALTGYGDAESRRRTAEAGFEAHLIKPVDLAALEGLFPTNT